MSAFLSAAVVVGNEGKCWLSFDRTTGSKRWNGGRGSRWQGSTDRHSILEFKTSVNVSVSQQMCTLVFCTKPPHMCGRIADYALVMGYCVQMSSKDVLMQSLWWNWWKLIMYLTGSTRHAIVHVCPLTCDLWPCGTVKVTGARHTAYELIPTLEGCIAQEQCLKGCFCHIPVVLNSQLFLNRWSSANIEKLSMTSSFEFKTSCLLVIYSFISAHEHLFSAAELFYQTT